MDYKRQLLNKIESKEAIIGIIGLGYVGLPLALEFAKKGFNTIGLDIDEKKIPILMKGESYIKHIPAKSINECVKSKKFYATTDFSKIKECDAVIICVPTPLDHHREPDLSYVESSAKITAQYLREGQLVTLESSTYPGTTEEILMPLFEKKSEEWGGGNEEGRTNPSKPGENEEYLNVGKKYFLAFSPEREDPNNPDYSTSTIPKVVGGVTPSCLEVACKLYDQVIVKTVAVSSPRAAEATKLLENIYRSINIALVNELKMVFDRMNIDVWEVIEAAKTKPFGFHPFYPGPGLGGHCIPIDPFYLTWKAHEFDISTKFIELAGEINTHQPYYVVERLRDFLNSQFQKSLSGAKILILGAAYKKNIDDMRESPTLKLIEILRDKGAIVDYHDTYVTKLPATRKYSFHMKSVELTAENVASYNAILVSTDHDNVDYKMIAQNAKLIIDTRNVFAKHGITGENIFKA